MELNLPVFGIKKAQTAEMAGGASGGATSASQSIAIGETDSHVFNCPSCARPLADGTSKCPGCNTRLIMGVALRRAGMILALGVVIGVLVGGAIVAAVLGMSLRERPVAVAAADVPVVASAAPAAVPTYAPHIPLAPSGAMAALSAAAVVNDRIANDARLLAGLLATDAPSSVDLARTLRALGADAAVGMDLTARLSPWTEATPVASQLDAFYRGMSQLTQTGLRAPLSDEAAYRDTATRMLTVIASIGDVDAAARALAATVELQLPPLTAPTATPTTAPAP
jgi:hypothetical protein